MASHKVNFICIAIQLSGLVLVALAILIAISGLKADFSLTNSESVFLVPVIDAIYIPVSSYPEDLYLHQDGLEFVQVWRG